MTPSLPGNAGSIDPRGHRFGAAVSAAMLWAAFLVDAPWVVALSLVAIGTSALFGMRYSVFGVIWRRLAIVLRLAAVEKEHAYPPRFAQTIGSVVLVGSLLAFLVGATGLGWLLALAVASLQTLLAVTGYCLGCRLYFVRWWLPSLMARLWQRGQPPVAANRIRYG